MADNFIVDLLLLADPASFVENATADPTFVENEHEKYNTTSLDNIEIDKYTSPEKKCFTKTDVYMSHLGRQKCVNMNKNFHINIQKVTKECFNELKEHLYSGRLYSLAEKLMRFGGESKIKKKICRYLENHPNKFSDEEDDTIFRETLPDAIIKELKELFIHSKKPREPSPIRIFRVEIPKIDEIEASMPANNDLKKILKEWIETLPLSKRDISGKIVKRDDIFIRLFNKLKPIIENRPKSEKLYRGSLKWQIKEIVKELPIATDSFRKKDLLTKVMNTLVDKISHLDGGDTNTVSNDLCKYSNNSRIDNFVNEKVGNFFQRTHLSIDDRERKCVENKIIQLFNNNVTSDKEISEEIYNVLRKVKNIPQHQAKCFSNELTWHFDYIFKVRNSATKKCVLKNEPNKPCTNIPNSESYTICRDSDANRYHRQMYKNQLIEKINEWLMSIGIEIPTASDINFKTAIIEGLAEDIINRQEFLRLNSIEIQQDQELQFLQFQIFKWIMKNVGEDNTDALEHADKLMENIGNIAVPNLTLPTSQSVDHSYDHVIHTIQSNNLGTRPIVIETLIDTILSWLQELPIDFYSFESDHVKIQLVEKLARGIEKTFQFNQNSEEIINTEIESWLLKLFERRPPEYIIDLLKNKIKSALCRSADINYRQIRFYIRRCEDIIDEWIDTLPIELTTEFASRRNQIVRNLAMKASTIKNIGVKSRNVDLRLANDITFWIKTLPLCLLHKKVLMEKYASNLLRLLQDSDVSEEEIQELFTDKLEEHVLDWLIKLPLYKSCSMVDKKKFEAITVDFTTQLKEIQQKDDIDVVIMKYITTLYANNNEDDGFLQNTIAQLKMYLTQLNYFGHLREHYEITDKTFDEIIEAWLHELPINFSAHEFERKKNELTDILKHLLATDTNREAVQKVIIEFIKSLPMHIDTVDDKVVVNKATKLLEKLNEIISEDTPFETAPLVSLIRNVIDTWAERLPFSPYVGAFNTICNKLAEDMTAVIAKLANENCSLNDIEQYVKLQIVNFLERFPSISNMVDVTTITSDLWMPLKTIIFKCDSTSGDILNAHRYLMQNELDRNVMNVTTCSSYRVEKVSPQLEEQFDDSVYRPSGSKSKLRFGKNANVRDSNTKSRSNNSSSIKMSGSYTLGVPHNVMNFSELEDLGDLPKEMNLEEVYEYFTKIIKEKCQEIPLDTSTVEQKVLADSARQVINNGIWKTFFGLMADPVIADDHVYFEFLFEDRLDKMLDILPQTADMVKFRYAWKINVLNVAIKMLKYVQKLSDSQSFRDKIVTGLSRNFIKNKNKIIDDFHQHLLTGNIADIFIITKKYEEEDPIKSCIYRQRLMTKVEELINYMKSTGNVEFRKLNRDVLTRKAMDILEHVPVPENDILKEEADEILLCHEIGEWYAALPAIPLERKEHISYILNARQALARKLLEIEDKALEINDPECEIEMKHEISQFLGTKVLLQPDQDLNVNFMVEELVSRLRNRKLRRDLGYETFERDKPISSSFVQTEAMMPLVSNNEQIPNEPERILQETLSPNQAPDRGRSASPNRRSHLSSTYPFVQNSDLQQAYIRSQSSRSLPLAQKPILIPEFGARDAAQDCCLLQRHQSITGAQTTPRGVAALANTGAISEDHERQLNYVSEEAEVSDEIHESQRPASPNHRPYLSKTYQFGQNSYFQNANIRPQLSRSLPTALRPSLRPEVGASDGAYVCCPSQGPQGNTEAQVTPRGATASTAKVTSQEQEREPDNYAEDEDDDESRFRCKCSERIWKRKSRRICPLAIQRQRMRCLPPLPLVYPYRFYY